MTKREVKPMVVGDHVCPKVSGPPAELARIESAVAALQDRYPRAIFDRYLGLVPTVHESSYVAAGAVIVGDVRLAANTSIWHHAVLRGDINHIQIGEGSNIQDGAVVHLGDNDPTIVGDHVVVGHRAVLHGCTIEDGCLIGMQARSAQSMHPRAYCPPRAGARAGDCARRRRRRPRLHRRRGRE